VVSAGETLWGIASQNSSGGIDPRDAVAVIQDLNSLDSGMIHPGQVLLVPKS
jgi:LysM repeat protein